MEKSKQKELRQNPFDRVNVRLELDALEKDIESLRIQYEQYFTGLLPLSPDKPHAHVKRTIRKLLKAPFRNSEMNFKLKVLEGRFNTLNSYWQRVLRQREEGTYHKDVFKAAIRDKYAAEEARAGTKEGAQERGIQTLFNSYQAALEKQTGAAQNLDFGVFKKTILQRTEDFKAKNVGKKLSFKISIKNGKVTLEAKAK